MDVARRQAGDARTVAVDSLHRLGVPVAIGEPRVAGGLRPALVAVEAEERHLLGEADHRLDERPHRARQASRPDLLEEPLFDEREPRLRRHQREGRPQPDERIDGQREEPEADLPLAGSVEPVQVVVHVGRHLRGREDVVVAQDAVDVIMFAREDSFAERRLTSLSDVLLFSALGIDLPLSEIYRDSGLG